MLTELSYNDDIRVRIGMEAPVEVAEVMRSAFHVYTDGSYTGAKNKHTRTLRTKQRAREEEAKEGFAKAKAGWAAVFFNQGPPPRPNRAVHFSPMVAR